MMLYIVRGLPGTGKSTLAKKLGYVCEADQYFETPNGYVFDGSQLPKAHNLCRMNVESAMKNEVTNIVVSNTFSQRWEMDSYYELAVQYNYNVTEITLTGTRHDNKHNVPLETIDKMIKRWEK